MLLPSSVLSDAQANNGFCKKGSVQHRIFFNKQKVYIQGIEVCSRKDRVLAQVLFWMKRILNPFFETITVNMIEDRDSEAKSNNNTMWWKFISGLGTHCLQYSRTKDILNKSNAYS